MAQWPPQGSRLGRSPTKRIGFGVQATHASPPFVLSRGSCLTLRRVPSHTPHPRVCCATLPSSLSPNKASARSLDESLPPPVCLPPPVKVKAPIFSLVPVDFQCWEPQSPFHIPGRNENVERRFPRASKFSGREHFQKSVEKKNDQSRRRRSKERIRKALGEGAWNGEAGRRNLDSGAGAGGFWLG